MALRQHRKELCAGERLVAVHISHLLRYIIALAIERDCLIVIHGGPVAYF